jgi:hypothetical protein
MHRDFEEVVGHLNKFRVELSFTRLFGALQAATSRNQKDALSKLRLYISTVKLTQQSELLRSLRSQLEAE